MAGILPGGYPGTLILVSHDRGLQNRCVTQIAHVSEGRTGSI